MHLEVGMGRADGSGSMKAETNHILHLDEENGAHAVIDFSVMEFEVTKELVDVPLLVFFRGVN